LQPDREQMNTMNNAGATILAFMIRDESGNRHDMHRRRVGTHPLAVGDAFNCECSFPVA
jgi:hypothetical protein